MTAVPTAPRPAGRGFTLMEMLAVLTLVSLLGTLLVQALGFFAARYDAVKRSQREAGAVALAQHWFATAVGGIVPVGVRERKFRGDGSTFAGTTLQPLAGASGVPAEVRWTVARGTSSVVYREHGLAAAAGEIAWPLRVPGEDSLSFQYADAQGRWHDEWPVPEAPLEWTPSLIRLIGSERAGAPRTVWIARVEAASYPMPNEDQLQ